MTTTIISCDTLLLPLSAHELEATKLHTIHIVYNIHVRAIITTMDASASTIGVDNVTETLIVY